MQDQPNTQQVQPSTSGPASDSYEVTVTITVGGNDPIDAVRCFLEVCADSSWHPLYADVVNLESADQNRYHVVFNARTDSGTIETIEVTS